MSIDLIGFAGWVCGPLLSQCEGGRFRLIYRALPVVLLGPGVFATPVERWRLRSDALLRSGEGSDHALGLVGWRRCPGPTDFDRCAGLQAGRAACRRALVR